MPFWPLRRADSPNQKIFRAAIVVGALTLLVKIGATGKELLVARTFGRGDALDAFLIAYLLPSFAVGLILSALTSTMIPAMVEARERQGTEAAQQLFSSMMVLSLVVLLAIALSLGFAAPLYLPYVASGFPPAKLELTRRLLYALLPFAIFSGFSGCAAALLNARERFALPALAPLLTTLATILFIATGSQRWGPFVFAGGIVAGSATEAIILAWALRRNGVYLRLRWYGFSPALRKALWQYAPMLAGALLTSTTVVVDQSMAAMLPAGSVATLGYAAKIVTAVLTIAATALATGAFPYLSRMVSQKDWLGCRNTLKKYSLLTAATTIPLTIGLIAFSKPLVRIMFQRGAFTGADTELVSWTQICYALQIPFYVCGCLFVRFMLAIRRSDILLIASAVSLALDIGLNLLLMKYYGVAGLALSTSCVHMAILLILAGGSYRFLHQQDREAPSMEKAAAVGPEGAH